MLGGSEAWHAYTTYDRQYSINSSIRGRYSSTTNTIHFNASLQAHRVASPRAPPRAPPAPDRVYAYDNHKALRLVLEPGVYENVVAEWSFCCTNRYQVARAVSRVRVGGNIAYYIRHLMIDGSCRIEIRFFAIFHMK